MPVPLSRLQKQLVNFDPEGVMLIRGQPGSGKTTVLLERARMLLRAYPRATVLLLAYNEALAARARHHLGDGPAPGRLAVRTLHGWAKALAEHEQVTFTNRFWADSTTRERFLKHILERPPADLAGTRMARWTPQQWSNEVEWLIGQDLQTLEAYLAAPRNGRGRAGSPLRAERDRVWPVFEQYRRELAAKGRHDLEDILGLIGKAAARSGKPLPQKASFDFVLVDEVQDLHLAWLKAVASVAPSEWPWWGGLGVKLAHHGVGVVGSTDGVVNIAFKTPVKAHVIAVVEAQQLWISVEDHEAFMKALAAKTGLAVSPFAKF